jgi:hypothetical protein
MSRMYRYMFEVRGVSEHRMEAAQAALAEGTGVEPLSLMGVYVNKGMTFIGEGPLVMGWTLHDRHAAALRELRKDDTDAQLVTRWKCVEGEDTWDEEIGVEEIGVEEEDAG